MDELGLLRQPLRDALTTQQVGIDIQEDFNASGTPTVNKLDDHVQVCEVVVHFVSDTAGAPANDASLRLLRQQYLELATDPQFAVRQSDDREGARLASSGQQARALRQAY